MRKDDLIFIRHILDSIHRIEEYTRDVKCSDFMEKPLVQDGVISYEVMKGVEKGIRDT